MSQVSSFQDFEKVNVIVEKYGKNPSNLISILQEIQETYRYLPKEILAYISSSMQVSPSVVYGVATFYENFSLEPKGKYVIRVCDGTACHVRGSNSLQETLKTLLNLKDGKMTTDDMLFTLETVSCLGACGLAPVMVINEKVHGKMTPDKTKALLAELKEKEGI